MSWQHTSEPNSTLTMNTERIHTTSQPLILWKHFHLGFRQCFNGDLFVYLLPLGSCWHTIGLVVLQGELGRLLMTPQQTPLPGDTSLMMHPCFYNLKYTLHYHQSAYSHKKAAHSYLYIAAIKYLYQLYNPTSKYSESDDYGQMSWLGDWFVERISWGGDRPQEEW